MIRSNHMNLFFSIVKTGSTSNQEYSLKSKPTDLDSNNKQCCEDSKPTFWFVSDTATNLFAV